MAMFFKYWDEDQERKLVKIFQETPGTLFDKAQKVNEEFSKEGGPGLRSVMAIVQRYQTIKRRPNIKGPKQAPTLKTLLNES